MGELPSGMVVPVAMVRVWLLILSGVRLKVVGVGNVTPEASIEVLPLYEPSKVTVTGEVGKLELLSIMKLPAI